MASKFHQEAFRPFAATYVRKAAQRGEGSIREYGPLHMAIRAVQKVQTEDRN